MSPQCLCFLSRTWYPNWLLVRTNPFQCFFSFEYVACMNLFAFHLWRRGLIMSWICVGYLGCIFMCYHVSSCFLCTIQDSISAHSTYFFGMSAVEFSRKSSIFVENKVVPFYPPWYLSEYNSLVAFASPSFSTRCECVVGSCTSGFICSYSSMYVFYTYFY